MAGHDVGEQTTTAPETGRTWRSRRARVAVAALIALLVADADPVAAKSTRFATAEQLRTAEAAFASSGSPWTWFGLGMLVAALGAAGVWALRRWRVAASDTQSPNEDQFLRELIVNIPESVWMLEAESFATLYDNPSRVRLLGLQPGDTCGPAVPAKTVHSADRQRVAEAYAQLRSTGNLNLEYRVELAGGEQRWVRDRAFLVRGPGNAPRIVGITDDATERRATEEALRESQRAMRTLLSNLPGMAYRCKNDANWTMEFVSQGCLELTGLPPDDLVGNRRRAFADLIHPEDRDRVWDDVQRELQRRGPFEFIYRIVTADGKTKWVREMGRGVFDDSGRLLALEGFIADDTERHRAEVALRESEQRNRHLVENAPIAIVIHSDEKFVFANPAAVQMLGAGSEKDLVGRSIWDIVHPDCRDAVRKRVQRIYQQAGAAPVIEEKFRRLDGTIIDVEVSGTSVSIGGRPASQAMFTDITQRKRNEAERLRLEAQLRQSQKMEAVGQLAGGVAHDFNNILTAIIGHLGLAHDAAAKTLPADHACLRGLREVERAANRATTLTRQLLTFSRKDVARRELLDVNRILADMREMLRRLIRESIQLDIRLAPDLHRICADANQIEQVILNLVVNASDAMPHGGQLIITTRNAKFDGEYVATQPDAQPGPHIVLSVSDTGEGMDKATLERIFEPFFTTKDVGQGTGLGLASVHGIVRQSGGHVTVYSEPKIGSTFKVCLPASADEGIETVEVLGAPADGPTVGAGETILVCEDDASVRQLVTDMLRDAGFNVLVADHGAAAMQVARRHPGPIHLLLTDVIMPEMNGRQLSGSLAEERPDMRTLYISGYASDVIAHHGVVDSGIEFLEKPFGPQDLLRRVREVLDRKPPGSPKGNS